jgi:magnesium-transporting ATPase (P-type)
MLEQDKTQTFTLTEEKQHSLSLERFLLEIKTDPSIGLSDAEIIQNREKYGVNKFSEPKKVTF